MAGTALLITLFLKEVPLSERETRVEAEKVGEKGPRKEARILD
jgi:hypothetical protein